MFNNLCIFIIMLEEIGFLHPTLLSNCLACLRNSPTKHKALILKDNLTNRYTYFELDLSCSASTKIKAKLLRRS